MFKVIRLIELEEGWREKPYYCSEGYPTVGYGFKIADKDAPLPEFSLPKTAGDAWLMHNLNELVDHLSKYQWFNKLNDARKAIILSMAYQMGVSGVLKFKNMIKFIEQDDYRNAALEMLDSRWAKQTPQRADRHQLQMQSGGWIEYYNQ